MEDLIQINMSALREFVREVVREEMGAANFKKKDISATSSRMEGVVPITKISSSVSETSELLDNLRTLTQENTTIRPQFDAVSKLKQLAHQEIIDRSTNVSDLNQLISKIRHKKGLK